jgi:AGZA family xanthine/uracil permease-like MFS transporter
MRSDSPGRAGGVLERWFEMRARGSSPGTELRAGVTTFLTLSYILAVNPRILGAAGMPPEDVVFATAVSGALGSALMGLLANYPFAVAAGMGMNAYFTFGVVQGLGVSFQVALTAVLVEGLLFVGLTLLGARRLLLRAIPASIRLAITAGIGLLLALVGLQNAGLVVDHPATLVGLGDLRAPAAGLALVGLAATGALLAARVRGAILLGIAGLTTAAWLLGQAPLPERWLAPPRLPQETLLAFEWSALRTAAFWPAVIAFLFANLFDTAGTLIGVGRLAGFLDARGELPRADQGFFADAAGTALGALLGTSPVTAYVESATGVEEGGRTGLAALVVAALFLLALPLAPLLIAIPAFATAPALVVVGALMLESAREIEWRRAEEALPALLTLALMPLTVSIANGIAAGLVGWVAIRALAGRAHEIPPVLGALAALIALYYALLA